MYTMYIQCKHGNRIFLEFNQIISTTILSLMCALLSVLYQLWKTLMVIVRKKRWHQISQKWVSIFRCLCQKSQGCQLFDITKGKLICHKILQVFRSIFLRLLFWTIFIYEINKDSKMNSFWGKNMFFSIFLRLFFLNFQKND